MKNALVAEIRHLNADGNSLPVMEIFPSLQGEGFHTGKAALFIRLAGCDLACNWCDVKEAWDAACWPVVPLDHIMEAVQASGLKSVVVTGGEPLMSDLAPLCRALKKEGIETFLETSGSYPVSGDWDWFCLSPKKQNPPNEAAFAAAHELKVVVANPEDLLWAEENASRVNARCLKFLQPEWSVKNKSVPLIVDYILLNPSWMLSLQSHKYIGIP